MGTIKMTSKVLAFKKENAGKWIWHNGAMGLETALKNNYIEDTREIAINKMANRDNVSIEDVENDYDNWYYILPIEEIEDDYLIDFFNK